MAIDEGITARIAARTRNVVHSVILVGGIGLVMGICAWLLWGRSGIVWAFVLIVFLLLLSPRIAPELLMRMYGARRVGASEGGPVLRTVAELARRADLPTMPQLYVVPSPIINAFATGSKGDSILAVTQGLLSRLDGRELVGVLAHEISHIKHNDLWIMGLADTMSRFTYFMSMTGVLLALFSFPMVLLGGPPVIPWLGILLLYFAPTAAALLQLGLSRAREYEADLEGARLSGDPEGLARALQKIESSQGRMWETIFMPGRSVPVPSVLRTHPPTEERVRRLMALRGSSRPPVQVPGLERVPAHFSPQRLRPRYHFTGLWY
jgi:heat shock protein HtpX